MKTLTIGKEEMKIAATPLAIVFYQTEFAADLMADWGLVEYRVNSFLAAEMVLRAADEKVAKEYKEVGVTPGDFEMVSNIPEDKLKEIIAMEEYVKEATKAFQENYDLEMTTLLQILYALNVAQRKKDKEDTIAFEDWLIKYEELKVMDIWENVHEEMQKLFSKSGTRQKEKKQAQV